MTIYRPRGGAGTARAQPEREADVDENDPDLRTIERLKTKIEEVFAHMGIAKSDWSLVSLDPKKHIIARYVTDEFAVVGVGMLCRVQAKVGNAIYEFNVQAHGATSPIAFGDVLVLPNASLDRTCEDLRAWLEGRDGAVLVRRLP